MKVLSLTLFLLLSVGALAQTTSTFDLNADGWTAANGVNPATTTYQSTGGNPGGYMSVAPPTSGGSVNISFGWYWVAPAKFFGNRDFSYDTNLKFDQQQSVAGTDNSTSDVVITGPSGTSIHFRYPTKPAVSPAWTSYSIPLNENVGWHYGTIGGALASRNQMKQILLNVTGVYIKCKYINSPGYTSGLDNVTFETRLLDTSPVITSFTPLSALPGASITINGTNFGATVSDNIVYFGNVKATIASGSSTQLTVTVPPAAQYSPISVINKTTSLVAKSTLDFLPLSKSDPDLIGHIIPSSFATNVIIPYGDFNDNGLAGATMGDIDNDGLLDIVGFEDGQDKCAIFLNLGQTGSISSASFSSKIEVATGDAGNAYGTFLIDLDNDGKLDLINYVNSGFGTCRNISTPGNVQFEAVESFYGTGIACAGMNMVDLDGDGRLDMLLSTTSTIFARNISTPGNIEFGALQGLTAAVGGLSSKDLNGDGKPELVIAGGSNYSILENLSTPGTIQFATPLVFTGSMISDICLADLDNDNKSDLVFYRINGFNNYDLVIRKNVHTSGPLTAASFSADVILSKINRAYTPRVADLNGDAKPDILICANSGSGGYGFAVFENATTPGTLIPTSFLEEVYFEETSIGSFVLPQIGDLDGDNLPDVVGFAGSDGGEAALIIYRNESTAPPHISLNTITPNTGPVGSTVTITGSKFSTVPAQNTVWFGAVKATVQSATKTALTVTVPPGARYDRVSVTRNYLTSRYHLPFTPTFSTGATFDPTSFLTPVAFTLTGADYDVDISDLNGDGKPEIIAESQVVTGIIRNYAWSFRNDYTTGPISTSSFTLDDQTNESAYDLRVVDLDEDGRPDILSQSSSFRNSTTASTVLFDNDVTIATGSNQSWADLDLDGKTDVIAANGTNLNIYRNQSRPAAFRTGSFPTFSGAYILGKPGNGGGTVVGDFDNDGNVDFASTNPTTDNIRVWKNAGGFPISTAQFVVAGDFAAGDNPGRLYVGDFDLDGKIDLMTYHNTGINTLVITVLHNQSTTGVIAFNRVDISIPTIATVACIHDLDGDGKPEIITTSEAAGKVHILKNISSPGVMTPSSFSAAFTLSVSGARGVTAGDLNLDGKPELIVTATPSKLFVIENAIPSVSITITTQPIDASVCQNQTATFSTDASGTTNIVYQWQFATTSTGTYADIANGAGYSNVTTKVLSVNTTGNFGAGFYRARVSGDAAASKFTNVVQLTIGTVPTAPTVTNGSRCGTGVVTLTAAGGSAGQYRWYSVATGGTPIAGQTNATYSPSISVTTSYYVSIQVGICESPRTTVSATINPIPAKPSVSSSITPVGNAVSVCSSNTLTLTAPAGFTSYTWSNGASTPQIVVSLSGSYTVTVSNAGCTSAASDAIAVTVLPTPCNNQSPVIKETSVVTTIEGTVSISLASIVSDADNNIDLPSAKIKSPPISGANGSITNAVLTVDYSGIKFSGGDKLAIEVCDLLGSCAQREIKIDVIGDLVIYNGVSPNNDGQNDFFFIQYIDALDETKNNKVSIYNRWGDEVFSIENYDNFNRVFKGLGNNGNELSSGTYFYKIEFKGGRKGETGYLSLKK